MSQYHDLKGKVVLVTGATDGLGKALSIELAKAGATVLVHGRDRGKCEALMRELFAAGAAEARSYLADFLVLDDVRAMAEAIHAREPALHVLVNNAGLGIEDGRRESRDGHEASFQVNHLAGYLLTHLLLPLLRRSAPSRIVNVASAGQWPLDFSDVMMTRNWKGPLSYGQSKLAQIMMTFDLARRLEGVDVTVNALHPASLMPTKMVVGKFTPRSSLQDGVRNVLRLVADSQLAGVTGRYFNESSEARAHEQSYNLEACTQLRSLSDRLCGFQTG